jgi:N-acetylglutamate synthase-like GNAT family acetyltransferase
MTKSIYKLRRHQPGDLGWVVSRHGEIYAREFGYDEQFEGVVAGVVSEFLLQRDRRRERCWIAEMNGERVGCVFLVRKTDRIGKLRMLLVEPQARGMGLGKRLIQECIRFASKAGYQKITLWTHASLTTARHLYQQSGFKLVKSVKNPSFGKNLIDETWELKL